MKKGFIIAIDGPVAAGKGTIAPALADALQGFYLYTGATYRALTLYCLRNNIDISNTQAVLATIPNAKINLFADTVLLNGKNITRDIKERDVAAATPVVAAMKAVRLAMVKRQQEITSEATAKGTIVIAEGRDTATVVFPHADLKVFLTASAKVRAKRRLAQLQELGNNTVSYDEVLQDTYKRDKEDTERDVDPLVKDPQAHGYFLLDDSEQTKEKTIRILLDEIKRRGLVV